MIRITHQAVRITTMGTTGLPAPRMTAADAWENAIRNFDLVGGEYYFDVGIFDQTGIVNIDYSTKIKSFFVKMDYIAEGIVVLKHDWSVKK